MLNTDLEAGPELDLAVGKAIGANVEIETDYVGDHGRYDRICVETVNGWDGIFIPSHSIAEAFEAAAKFGLFTKDRHNKVYLECHLILDDDCQREVERWDVSQLVYQPDIAASRSVGISLGPTPAVAICLAIVKLAEAKQEAQ